MSPLMALFGHGEMSDLSPLTVPKLTCFRRVLLPRNLQKARGPEAGLWAPEPIGKGQPLEIRREFIRAFS